MFEVINKVLKGIFGKLHHKITFVSHSREVTVNTITQTFAPKILRSVILSFLIITLTSRILSPVNNSPLNKKE